MAQTVIIAAATAMIVSIICCNVKIRKAFEVVDAYVKDMIEMAKESIRNAYVDK